MVMHAMVWPPATPRPGQYDSDMLLRVPKAPYVRRPCGGRKGGGYLCCSCCCCSCLCA